MKKILQSDYIRRRLKNQPNMKCERGHSFQFFFEGCLVDDEDMTPAAVPTEDRGLRLALTFAPSNKQS
jgi:hypothetical protein